MIGIYQKCKPIKDIAARRLYILSRYWCLFCGKSGFDAAQEVAGLCVHHIIRFQRSDEACNFASACMDCHAAIHAGDLSLGMVLWAKRARDPEHWNPARLAELHGQALPELVPMMEVRR